MFDIFGFGKSKKSVKTVNSPNHNAYVFVDPNQSVQPTILTDEVVFF